MLLFWFLLSLSVHVKQEDWIYVWMKIGSVWMQRVWDALSSSFTAQESELKIQGISSLTKTTGFSEGIYLYRFGRFIDTHFQADWKTLIQIITFGIT